MNFQADESPATTDEKKKSAFIKQFKHSNAEFNWFTTAAFSFICSISPVWCAMVWVITLSPNEKFFVFFACTHFIFFFISAEWVCECLCAYFHHLWLTSTMKTGQCGALHTLCCCLLWIYINLDACVDRLYRIGNRLASVLRETLPMPQRLHTLYIRINH